jgi:hypothetical protein
MFEIFIHFLMPYTFFDSIWVIHVLGKDLKYSLSILLCCLSLLRSYVLMKVIRNYNIFTSDRSKRMLKFFGGYKKVGFLYRSNMHYRSFKSIFVIALFILIFFTIWFKYVENFSSNDDFYKVENCMWFVLYTMTTSIYF